MTAEDCEAWCDARAVDDEPPPGLGEEEEPDPEPGEHIWGTAGFTKDGFADGLPGGSELTFLADAAAGPEDRYPVRPMVSWTG